LFTSLCTSAQASPFTISGAGGDELKRLSKDAPFNHIQCVRKSAAANRPWHICTLEANVTNVGQFDFLFETQPQVTITGPAAEELFERNLKPESNPRDSQLIFCNRFSDGAECRIKL
jgi:hypothetical protein